MPWKHIINNGFISETTDLKISRLLSNRVKVYFATSSWCKITWSNVNQFSINWKQLLTNNSIGKPQCADVSMLTIYQIQY